MNNQDLISFVGEINIQYQKHNDKPSIEIKNSFEVSQFIRTIFPNEIINHREHAYTILLNRKNQIIGYYLISSGGLSATVIDPKVVFQSALLTNASSIILFHNHPSGNLEPSKADKAITQKIKKGGQFLEIPLLDHLIISDVDYYSFADNGEL